MHFFALFWQWIKAKSSRNPQEFQRWEAFKLGFCKQMVMADSKFFLYSEHFFLIHRLIVWTNTWNLRFHFSLLLHWKNRLEKYTVYWFPHFFSFVHKFVRLVDKFWVIISVSGFLDPICNSVDVIRHSELFENYFLHWNSQQVFWWTWNLLAAQFVQEGHVSKETIFILRTWRNQFVQKVGTVLLGDFISYEIKKFEYVF